VDEKVVIEISEGGIVIRGDYKVAYNFLLNWEMFSNLLYRAMTHYGKEESKRCGDLSYRESYELFNTHEGLLLN
jgi:hypothetical protein